MSLRAGHVGTIDQESIVEHLTNAHERRRHHGVATHAGRRPSHARGNYDTRGNGRGGRRGRRRPDRRGRGCTHRRLDGRDDRRAHRALPNQLVAIVGLAAAVGVGTAAIPGSAALAAVAGALILAGPLFALHVATPTAIGFGDVKLAAALGARSAPSTPLLGLVALCVATGSTAVSRVVDAPA
jgi:hypothetical protein